MESFVEVTDTNQFLKTLYTDLPPFVVPGTESFSESSGVVLSSDHPQAAGRPSSKRKKSAMDYVAGAAHKARHANAIEWWRCFDSVETHLKYIRRIWNPLEVHFPKLEPALSTVPKIGTRSKYSELAVNPP